MATTTVAVLGTGIMGSAMARSLLRAGLAVQAWNRDPHGAEPLADAGARLADSPARAVEGVDVVVTMVTDADAVLDVARDFLPAMAEGAVWAQMGTIGLEGTDRAIELARTHGVTLVDAPVSGTKEPAEKGQLEVLASGPEGAREACRPVFDAVGSSTLWLGDEPGAGTRMKTVVNTWLLGVVTALADTVALAESLDLDPADFLRAIEGGPLDSPYAQLKGKMMTDHDYPASFPLAHAGKDAHLALAAAEGSGLTLTVVPAIAALFDRAEADHGREDMAAIREAVGRPD